VTAPRPVLCHDPGPGPGSPVPYSAAIRATAAATSCGVAAGNDRGSAYAPKLISPVYLSRSRPGQVSRSIHRAIALPTRAGPMVTSMVMPACRASGCYGSAIAPYIRTGGIVIPECRRQNDRQRLTGTGRNRPGTPLTRDAAAAARRATQGRAQGPGDPRSPGGSRGHASGSLRSGKCCCGRASRPQDILPLYPPLPGEQLLKGVFRVPSPFCSSPGPPGGSHRPCHGRPAPVASRERGCRGCFHPRLRRTDCPGCGVAALRAALGRKSSRLDPLKYYSLTGRSRKISCAPGVSAPVCTCLPVSRCPDAPLTGGCRAAPPAY
jgi:hypothetical protein